MPYPTKYARQYDFQGYQVSNPTRPLPGDKVNDDLNAVEQSVDEIVEFLKGPIRSDGKLANGSVGVDQLNPNLNLGFSLPTVWEAHVDYTADSTVLYANKFWKSKAAHTSSGGFDESKWDEIVDFGAQADAAAASAAAALASENAAEASASSASDSADAASASASSASGDAATATTKAGEAAASALAAGVSATDAGAAFSDFDKRYLGAKAADPTLDNGGGALVAGALYWSTVASALKVYDGAVWQLYGASPGTDLSGVTDPEAARENLGLGVGAGMMQLTDTADSTTVAAAIAALNVAGGGTLRLLKGVYDLSSVALKSNVTVRLEAGAVINQSSGSVVFTGTGATSGSAIPLTANATEDAYTASVADTTGFAVGDYYIIRTNQYLSSPSGRNQEIVRILSLTSTVLTFERGLTSSYATANSAEIIKLNPIINAAVVGEGAINIGAGLGGGIIFTMGVGCRMGDRVRINAPKNSAAFRLQLCTESKILGGVAANGQNLSGSGQGYGFELDESCTFCEVAGFVSNRVRENTITNRSRRNKVHDNFALNSYDSGFNTHGADCRKNEIYDNTIIGGGAGITIGWSGALAPDKGNIVRSNVIRNTGAGAISLSGKSGANQSGNVVQSNEIEASAGVAIAVSYGDDEEVADNIIRTTTANGIDVSDCTRPSVVNNKIRGDGTTTGRVGVRMATSTDGLIGRNSVRRLNSGGGAASYYVPSGTGVVVCQNDHDGVAASLTSVTEKYNSWN